MYGPNLTTSSSKIVYSSSSLNCFSFSCMLFISSLSLNIFICITFFFHRSIIRLFFFSALLLTIFSFCFYSYDYLIFISAFHFLFKYYLRANLTFLFFFFLAFTSFLMKILNSYLIPFFENPWVFLKASFSHYNFSLSFNLSSVTLLTFSILFYNNIFHTQFIKI